MVSDSLKLLNKFPRMGILEKNGTDFFIFNYVALIDAPKNGGISTSYQNFSMYFLSGDGRSIVNKSTCQVSDIFG